jgi:eukaryotic-like serine/threonine-protein kinase
MMSDSSADRDPLDRLAEEFVARHRAGERPSLTEYAGRLPDRADEVLELFPALVEMEQLKPVSSEQTGDFASPTPEPGLPGRLGDYRIIRLVGRGGMGAVYEAVQESLGRHVALKLLPADALADPRRLERFRREARSAARLHHTNIVPVFGVREADGRHFYAMQFISGHPLDAVIDEVRRLKEKSTVADPGAVSEVAVALITGNFVAGTTDASPSTPTALGEVGDGSASNPALPVSLSDGGRHYWATVARLGAQVAEALAYAHGQGILHRDIKPANLLLDLQGTVWVADFGLAKSSDADNLTHTGDVVGTLRYLAPERFDGVGDHRADVYALGLTLYELLTLRPAFLAENRAKLVEQVLAASPPKPRSIDPSIPRDLETVVLKATARDPALRYQSAAELGDDLRRYIEDRPIRARRATTAEQTVRWCRRNPAVASLIATVLLAILAGAGVASLYALRAERERGKAVAREQEAILAREEAEAATKKAIEAGNAAMDSAEEARKRLTRLYVFTGTRYQDDRDTPAALLWFHRAWEQDHADPLADAAHRTRIAGALTEMPDLIGACFHSTVVCDAVFSPDGRRVLTRTDGNEAYLWDYEQSRLASPALLHAARVRHILQSRREVGRHGIGRRHRLRLGLGHWGQAIHIETRRPVDLGRVSPGR